MRRSRRRWTSRASNTPASGTGPTIPTGRINAATAASSMVRSMFPAAASRSARDARVRRSRATAATNRRCFTDGFAPHDAATARAGARETDSTASPEDVGGECLYLPVAASPSPIPSRESVLSHVRARRTRSRGERRRPPHPAQRRSGVVLG